MTEYNQVDCETWVFEIEGFHLDAPQEMKSRVADEHDVQYRNLRAKVIEDTFTRYVVVLRTVY